MRVSDAAKILCVSAITLRRLEKFGIIHPLRDRNGWRRFDERSLEEARKYLYPGAKKGVKNAKK